MRAPTSEIRALDSIRPYPNNPRRIPEEAVTAVRTSIERFGYSQPIVVDTDGVVVVGHTRLLALQQMGVVEAEVYVTDLPKDKADEYRLVDNRTGEMSAWDHSALVVELREFEEKLLGQFFPDVDLEVAALDDAMVTDADVEAGTKKVLSVKPSAEVRTTDVVCPSCLATFQVRTDTLPNVTRADLVRTGTATQE